MAPTDWVLRWRGFDPFAHGRRVDLHHRSDHAAADPTLCTGTCASSLAAYVFENFTIPAPPGTQPPVDNPGTVTGAALFNQAGCATCHGTDGLGTTLAAGSRARWWSPI